MKKVFFLLLVMVSIAGTLEAQTRKEKRAERRVAQDSIDNANHIRAIVAITDTLLILEADQAYDDKGDMVLLDRTFNFVKLEKERGVVQLAFPFLVGPNGVGGITIDGRISKYEVKTDKNGSVHLLVFTSGSSVDVDIRITLSPGSDRATATVSSGTLPQSLRFSGVLNHIYQSDYFEGSTVF